MLRGVFVSGFIVLLFLIFTTPAFCTNGKAADAKGVEALTELLRAKGLISAEEAAAFKGNAGGAEVNAALKPLVDLLKNKGILSDGEASGLQQALAQGAAPGQATAKSILVVPRDKEYVRKISENVVTEVKKDVHEQVEAEIAEKTKAGTLGVLAPNLPDWVRNVRVEGDFRLRYEGDFYPGDNAKNITNPNTPGTSKPFFDTQINRDRELLRFRLKLETDINDQVTVGVRLATGTQQNPVSTNTTFGDYYNKEGFLLDQAYLRYSPIKELALWGGRIPNIWFSSELVWDNDLNFEGFAASYRRELLSCLSGFLVMGAFPLQEEEFTQRDKWLLGGQVGLEYKPNGDVSGKLGLALYDYENVQGKKNLLGQNTFDYTAPLFMQKGNTVFDISNPAAGTTATSKYALAADFRELDVIGTVDIAHWDPIHVIFLGDYVKNVAFDGQEVHFLSNRSINDMQDYAYQFGVTVGYPRPRKFAQWNVFGYYRYVGTDAVIDAFTDSDFHLGGTNAKGWTFGGELGLMKNLWLTARWMSADQISPYQFSNGPFSVDVFQLDANAAF